MQALLYTLAPVLVVVLGAIVASRTKLKPRLVAGLQHLAAGVVFAAAATEILPQVKHEASPSATLIGGAAGVATMLGLTAFEARFKGPMALLAAISIDILVDGLVLGLAFVAGEKAGFLLTIALTLEVLFLGLTLTDELAETYRSRLRIIVIRFGIGTVAADRCARGRAGRHAVAGDGRRFPQLWADGAALSRHRGAAGRGARETRHAAHQLDVLRGVPGPC